MSRLRTRACRARMGALSAAAVFLAVWLGSPTPVAADGASGKNYDSVIRSVRPEASGITVRVVEGDDALELRNRSGQRLKIDGYDDEPYLRFEADGTVLENLRSPTKYTNEDRYGLTPLPKIADSDAPPRWRAVSSNGAYVWHDHRVHWMSKERPEEVSDPERRTKIFDWVVPIDSQSDGRIRVKGTLYWDRHVGSRAADEEQPAGDAETTVAARQDQDPGTAAADQPDDDGGTPVALIAGVAMVAGLGGLGFARFRRNKARQA